jgi:glc operon protein GlcG
MPTRMSLRSIVGCALVAGIGWATPSTAQQAAPAAPMGPTLAQAQKAMAASFAAAAKMGATVLLSCVVVDTRGDLVALERMDGAKFFTTDVARGKAITSAMFGQPSGNMAGFGSTPFFPNLNATVQGRMFPIQGAVPIMMGGKPAGAVGCSGGASQQDEDAAKAGAATF